MSGESIDLQGLTPEEAQRRLSVHGPNALPEVEGTSLAARLLNQFKSPLIYILLFALGLDLMLWVHERAWGIPFESITIGLILILNAGLGAYQESKAEKALARLKAMAMPAAWVRREGILVQIPAQEIVPGDIARVEAGDRVPADGKLVEGQGIAADESILTGESLPVARGLGDELLSGTLVVRSKGYIEVNRTGPESAMGRLAGMIGGIEASKTPLERRLAKFGSQVAIAILAIGLLLTIGGAIVEGVGRLGQVVLFSVALAVAAVPEGLPAVMTLTLAMGVVRLAGRKAIVRRLSAVEALGSVTVIATDKTGTLTENRMHVHGIEVADEERALHAMVLANDAEIATETGDPLEVALLQYAKGRGINPKEISASRPRLSSQPFDSEAKFMRVTVREDARTVSYLKGAPEVLIGRSSLGADYKRHWENKAFQHAAQGNRVLALGWCEGESNDIVTFLGLIMLWDPPRSEVPAALQNAKAAGIRVLMITGDHPATAKAVGATIGIASEMVVTGSEVETASPDELRRLVQSVNLFARVSPEHKLRLVEALKQAGEIVAVTGDGVNDAPALKRSDVGIAMGQRGSDVSREVADVVLLDDNFATIVAAIEEGRSIYENVQKFVRFFFSTDLALILLMIAGLALAFLSGVKDPSGGTFLLPLTAVQLLWINVVADGPPALALAFDRNPGVMRRPPRPLTSNLLDQESVRFIVLTGGLKAAVGISLLVLMPYLDFGLEETRTAVFLYESVMQLAFVYPCRRINGVPLPNKWVHWAVGLGVALQVFAVTAPPLRTMLGLVNLTSDVMLIISMVVVGTWGVALVISRKDRGRQ